MPFRRTMERRVKEGMERHLKAVGHCLEKFEESVLAFLRGDYEGALRAAMEVHRLESEADSERREIQRGLFRGAFMPLLREDFLKLTELMDSVANKAEEVCDQLVLERPEIPEEVREELEAIPSVTVEAFGELAECVRSLWENVDEALERAAVIQAKEHEVDELRWRALRKVFGSDMELARKLQMRDLVARMSEISDRIEDASDYIVVIAVKSRV